MQTAPHEETVKCQQFCLGLAFKTTSFTLKYAVLSIPRFTKILERQYNNRMKLIEYIRTMK